MQRLLRENVISLENILFTDESTFYIDNAPNKQNVRYWSKGNPKSKRLIQTNTQYKVTVNTWAGLIGNHIIGPFFIEDGRLNQHNYANLLREKVFPALHALNINVIMFSILILYTFFTFVQK